MSFNHFPHSSKAFLSPHALNWNNVLHWWPIHRSVSLCYVILYFSHGRNVQRTSFLCMQKEAKISICSRYLTFHYGGRVYFSLKNMLLHCKRFKFQSELVLDDDVFLKFAIIIMRICMHRNRTSICVWKRL